MKSKIFKQIGGTCGYYAFINSLKVLFSEVKFSHEDVLILLKNSVSMNVTNVGEIFKYPPNFIFEDYIEKRNLDVDFSIENISNVQLKIKQLSEGEAIIISIASGKTSSHWIGIVNINGSLRVLDSNKKTCVKFGRKYKNLEGKHRKLQNRVFDFKPYFKLSNKIIRIITRYVSSKSEIIRYKDNFSDSVLTLITELEREVEKKLPEKIEIESGSFYILKRK